jgi:hypothetical protein
MPVCGQCGGPWFAASPGEADIVVDYHLRRPRQHSGRNEPAQYWCFGCWVQREQRPTQAQER